MHCLFSVTSVHMLDTKWQIGVIKVFQKYCHRLYRAVLLNTLLKVHAMDQESIFWFELRHLFIYFVLGVIIHHS